MRNGERSIARGAGSLRVGTFKAEGGESARAPAVPTAGGQDAAGKSAATKEVDIARVKPTLGVSSIGAGRGDAAGGKSTEGEEASTGATARRPGQSLTIAPSESPDFTVANSRRQLRIVGTRLGACVPGVAGTGAGGGVYGADSADNPRHTGRDRQYGRAGMTGPTGIILRHCTHERPRGRGSQVRGSNLNGPAIPDHQPEVRGGGSAAAVASRRARTGQFAPVNPRERRKEHGAHCGPERRDG